MEEAKPRGTRAGGAALQLVPASNRVAAVVSQEDAGHVEEHMEDVGEDGPGSNQLLLPLRLW